MLNFNTATCLFCKSQTKTKYQVKNCLGMLNMVPSWTLLTSPAFKEPSSLYSGADGQGEKD